MKSHLVLGRGLGHDLSLAKNRKEGRKEGRSSDMQEKSVSAQSCFIPPTSKSVHVISVFTSNSHLGPRKKKKQTKTRR